MHQKSFYSALLFFFFLLIAAPSQAEVTKILSFNGYLGDSELDNSLKILKELNDQEVDTLILEVNSSSGELNKLLEVAKEIYRLKSNKNTKVILYIDDNAIGPAAILPFLSDQLYTSKLVTWGDISLGTDDSLPTNLLKARVTSLIDSNHLQVALLKQVAAAMSDKELVVISNGQMRLQSQVGDDLVNMISSKGEALVLNHNQLAELGLIEASLSLQDFRKKVDISVDSSSEEIKKTAPSITKKEFNKELEERITFNPNGENLIGHITIDDKKSGINQSTWIYVKSALEYYKEKKPAFIILELNTPGGEVFASQNISDALRDMDTQENIPVIAFIDNWAISAGAMLAYSTRFITATKDASMGAAEPVIMSKEGQMESASEKVNSALRTDFANRARFFDRNPDIAEAMVDKDIILVLRHGKIVRLDKENQIKYKGQSPDKVITKKGKLLTLNSEDLMEYGVANSILEPHKLESITSGEIAKGKWSFSKVILSKNPILSKIPNAIVDSYRMDLRTQFFAILAMPIVSSLLMLGMLLGFYVEFNTPGFGIPGAVGLTCLVLIIIANLSLEIASWIEVILMLVGLTMIAIEFSVIPTGGILGLIGVFFFVGGLFAIMLPGLDKVDFEFDTQTVNAAGEEFIRRLAWLSGTLVVGFGLIAFLSRYISPSLAGLNRLVLSGHEQEAAKGYVSGEAVEKLPHAGEKGEVLATLRPAGKVVIEKEVYDAVTSGEFIEKGSLITVDHLDGSVIVVSRSIEESNKV